MVFDQSSAHNAFAADALNARKMNVGPGGKQAHMHNTTIPHNNPSPHLRGTSQTMIFDSSHPMHPNQPKGMEVIIKERQLWEQLVTGANGKKPLGRCKSCKASAAEREKLLAQAQAVILSDPDAFYSIGERIYPPLEQIYSHNYPNIDNALESIQDDAGAALAPQATGRFCCMEKCLSTEQDFVEEKPLLQLVVEEAGHMCILLPKFHCELNPIEMYWGYAKQSKPIYYFHTDIKC